MSKHPADCGTPYIYQAHSDLLVRLLYIHFVRLLLEKELATYWCNPIHIQVCHNLTCLLTTPAIIVLMPGCSCRRT